MLKETKKSYGNVESGTPGRGFGLYYCEVGANISYVPALLQNVAPGPTLLKKILTHRVILVSGRISPSPLRLLQKDLSPHAHITKATVYLSSLSCLLLFGVVQHCPVDSGRPLNAKPVFQ